MAKLDLANLNIVTLKRQLTIGVLWMLLFTQFIMLLDPVHLHPYFFSLRFGLKVVETVYTQGGIFFCLRLGTRGGDKANDFMKKYCLVSTYLVMHSLIEVDCLALLLVTSYVSYHPESLLVETLFLFLILPCDFNMSKYPRTWWGSMIWLVYASCLDPVWAAPAVSRITTGIASMHLQPGFAWLGTRRGTCVLVSFLLVQVMMANGYDFILAYYNLPYPPEPLPICPVPESLLDPPYPLDPELLPVSRPWDDPDNCGVQRLDVERFTDWSEEHNEDETGSVLSGECV